MPPNYKFMIQNPLQIHSIASLKITQISRFAQLTDLQIADDWVLPKPDPLRFASFKKKNISSRGRSSGIKLQISRFAPMQMT